MQELNVAEIEQISGAGFFSRIGEAIGFVYGGGAAQQKYIDSFDNSMLGAMQYGA